jgi:Tfp pilus assembly protein PilZ
MAENSLKNNYLKDLEERKDARKRFGGLKPIVADCQTMDSTFKATVQDVSSAGIFLKTSRKLPVGQEIAVTFIFPQTRQTIMATGEVARITREGVGVEIKLFFKE